MPVRRNQPQAQLSVYLDNGDVFEYDVAPSKVREHAHAIVMTGYRRCDANGEMTHYPPHRILKVKATGGDDTMYPDRQRGT